MSFDSDQAKLAERLRRSLAAMDDWEPARRLQYKIRLGVKNREALFTRAFGGEGPPEPDSVPALAIPDTEDKPLVRLLYVLKHADDICLDGPTARSIVGRASIPSLVRLLKQAVSAGYASRGGAAEPSETDEDVIVGIKLTEPGRLYLERVLLLGEMQGTSAT
jgi:hypothetical protein